MIVNVPLNQEGAEITYEYILTASVGSLSFEFWRETKGLYITSKRNVLINGVFDHEEQVSYSVEAVSNSPSYTEYTAQFGQGDWVQVTSSGNSSALYDSSGVLTVKQNLSEKSIRIGLNTKKKCNITIHAEYPDSLRFNTLSCTVYFSNGARLTCIFGDNYGGHDSRQYLNVAGTSQVVNISSVDNGGSSIYRIKSYEPNSITVYTAPESTQQIAMINIVIEKI